MKTCTKCRNEKDDDVFNKNARSKDGLHFWCKDCVYEYNHIPSVKEASRKASAAYRARNLDARRLADRGYSKTYRVNNPEANKKWRENSEVKKRLAEYMREWRKTARVKSRNRGDKRTMKSTPLWANSFFIGEIYALARLRTKMLGKPWEVDHVIPLNGETVCGFHVENNLRVIPRPINRAKKNKFLETEGGHRGGLLY